MFNADSTGEAPETPEPVAAPQAPQAIVTEQGQIAAQPDATPNPAGGGTGDIPIGPYAQFPFVNPEIIQRHLDGHTGMPVGQALLFLAQLNATNASYYPTDERREALDLPPTYQSPAPGEPSTP